MTTKTLCYVSLMCLESTDRWLAVDVEWRQRQMDRCDLQRRRSRLKLPHPAPSSSQKRINLWLRPLLTANRIAASLPAQALREMTVSRVRVGEQRSGWRGQISLVTLSETAETNIFWQAAARLKQQPQWHSIRLQIHQQINTAKHQIRR